MKLDMYGSFQSEHDFCLVAMKSTRNLNAVLTVSETELYS